VDFSAGRPVGENLFLKSIPKDHNRHIIGSPKDDEKRNLLRKGRVGRKIYSYRMGCPK
jgi:hypothetical protein